ncbi:MULTISPECIES: flavin reductase family protein [unclassified Acinetobacter]|uniref:flavin reductase family protein n=1 Tax=unclassified Acinetobacter TaxID=196816 RepID=UPI00190C9780|nr:MULTISPECIES: iron-sulfur cluster-binding domain-containing protein [unclassified Acinetobacter]MBK0064293.1 iron-sulfur cluster-binding domain-containing protein [Acinetobacter sp. S55]MBK0067715.1 iron-sulfur cluster-binding domain-containing protein [Acinetobacter sp. S54]
MNIAANYQPQWIREDFVDFILEKVNPMWTWKKVKAQVTSVKAITPELYQICLQSNSNFAARHFKAGQSILVTVVVAGVRYQRSYSVMQIDAQGNLYLGIKVQGVVSRAMSQLQSGDVIEISQTQGEFCLHTDQTAAVLIASGSGITAIYSLLQQAIQQQLPQIDVIYFSRDAAFHHELQRLAERYPMIHYHHIDTLQQKQHLTPDLLNKLVSDLEQKQTYLCGASGMMQAAKTIFAELNLADRLHMEYFQPVVDETLEAQPVIFLRSQQEFEANTNLLESAEQAGLRPSHGCRMGICNTCTCTKVSGSTKNILTGEIDHGNNTQIRLCVSQAISPVVINL